MIYVAALLALVLLAGSTVLHRHVAYLHRLIDDERNRSRELLALVEVQRAPAAYVAVTSPVSTEDDNEWIHDETGLYGMRLDG